MVEKNGKDVSVFWGDPPKWIKPGTLKTRYTDYVFFFFFLGGGPTKMDLGSLMVFHLMSPRVCIPHCSGKHRRLVSLRKPLYKPGALNMDVSFLLVSLKPKEGTGTLHYDTPHPDGSPGLPQ